MSGKKRSRRGSKDAKVQVAAKEEEEPKAKRPRRGVVELEFPKAMEQEIATQMKNVDTPKTVKKAKEHMVRIKQRDYDWFQMCANEFRINRLRMRDTLDKDVPLKLHKLTTALENLVYHEEELEAMYGHLYPERDIAMPSPIRGPRHTPSWQQNSPPRSPGYSPASPGYLPASPYDSPRHLDEEDKVYTPGSPKPYPRSESSSSSEDS